MLFLLLVLAKFENIAERIGVQYAENTLSFVVR